jgi:hypothetical protein
MLPDDHWFASALDVWVVLSSLSQLIVVPTAIVSGFCPNAVVVRVDAPPAIFTVVLPAGAGVGPVEGAEGELYPPQAVKAIASIRTDVRRISISFDSPALAHRQKYCQVVRSISCAFFVRRHLKVFE